jgi:hypothetical protein
VTPWPRSVLKAAQHISTVTYLDFRAPESGGDLGEVWTRPTGPSQGFPLWEVAGTSFQIRSTARLYAQRAMSWRCLGDILKSAAATRHMILA